jgi:integrase
VIRKTIRFNKCDARYWRERVAFQTKAARTYSAQIQHAGERRWIGLATANKDDAASIAAKLYVDIRSRGWDAVMGERRGDAEKKCDVTISEYIEAVRAKSLLYPKTITSYAQALRKIAGDITGHASSLKRDSIKLRSLTSEKIEAWRIDFIRRKATDPLAEKSARVSANSFLHRARSLFSKDTIARVSDLVEVPDPVPFAGVKGETGYAPRYRSSIDFAELIESAIEELQSEPLKIFLLAGFAGLRRHEIDLLPWSAFRFDENVIRIAATQHFRPKSPASEGDVHIESELVEIFRGFYAKRGAGEFVIESSEPPPPLDAPYDRYRCAREFVALLRWLRAHGVENKKPLHALRKEFGSQLNARYGLLSASEQLRHASVATTAKHYVENRERPVVGLGHLLNRGERRIVAIAQDDEKQSAS